MKFVPFICVAVLACVLPCFAADISLSGTVTDLSGHVLSGGGVSLVGAGNATTTNTSGAWSLSGPSTGIVVQPKSSARLATRHLVLDGSRIRLRFDGVDPVGRASSGAYGMGDGSLKTAGTVVAARSVAVYVDTLLYSWNGQVRARVGISSLLAGALGPQAIDTSPIAISYDSLVYGGQTYKTVRIGTQTWMAENLNYKVDSSWCYENSADSCSKYGRLYKWAAVMKFPDSCNLVHCTSLVHSKHQGICPTGWHVPSDSEWTTLTNYVGGANKAGERLKSTSGWWDSAYTKDYYGFRALPAGLYVDHTFFRVGGTTSFWSSSEVDDANHGGYAWDRYVYTTDVALGSWFDLKTNGYSFRCIKD